MEPELAHAQPSATTGFSSEFISNETGGGSRLTESKLSSEDFGSLYVSEAAQHFQSAETISHEKSKTNASEQQTVASKVIDSNSALIGNEKTKSNEALNKKAVTPETSQTNFELEDDFSPRRSIFNSVRWLLFSFQGRVTRLPFLAANLVAIPAIVAGPMILENFLSDLEIEAATQRTIVLSCSIAIYLIFGWIALATSAKRWHDRGSSGWWSLLGITATAYFFLPIAGNALWLAVLPTWHFISTCLLPGNCTDNEYGLNPRFHRWDSIRE